MAYNPGGQPPYNPQYPYNAAPPPPPPKSGMGTGAKVALFGCLALILLGIVAAIIGGVVMVAMSNKNGNSVANTNSTSNTNSSAAKNANSSARNAATPPGGSTSASGVHVESIGLARDKSGQAGETVENFEPADNPMHAVVKLSDSASGTKVRVVLMAVSVATGEKNTKVAEIERDTGPLQSELDTTFTLPKDWPTGTYRVDVYINGNLDKSLTFQVES